jgi:hypothetical protein
MLIEVFLGFDRAAKRLGLEKIKTIGDAYMVVAGIPEPRIDHVQLAAEMGLAMQTHVDTLSPQYPDLRLRIGIHTGPVVAGVIGENKFAYDLWGDNVNIASRMESHGLAGRIHVSEAFVRAADDKWHFEARGSIEVKGQGPMNTYFLSRHLKFRLENDQRSSPGLRRHVYTNTLKADRRPDKGEEFIIDRWPNSRLIVASACSGHGVKFAPAIGEKLARLAIDPAYEVEPFFQISRYSRFA